MKRTMLSSVAMVSVMVSTVGASAFAGHGGGSGGRSFGGGNSAGKSVGGNFAAQSVGSSHSPTQVMQKFNGNINKVSGGPQFTQKLQHINTVGSKSIGTNVQGISNQGLKNNVLHANGNSSFKSCKNNWWCSTGSNCCGGWFPGKYCGSFGCYPYFGCYSNFWYPNYLYYYPTCGYNYSYYNCSYGPQYCSPLSVAPVSYGSNGVTTTASAPVVVNVDARDAETSVSPASAAKTVAADKLMEMKLGGTYALPGAGFGTKAGQMFVEIGDVALGVKVDDWDDQKVSFTLPMIGLAKATDAKLHLVSSEGKEIKSADVRLVMPTQLTAQQ